MSRRSASFLLGALVVAAILVLPLFLTQNELRNFARFLVLVLAVLGVNVALGAGGIVSLGQSVFVGVGAFALVSFSDDFGLPILVALPLAALFTGGVGVVLGFPSLRVRDSQFALVSFGYAIAFPPFARWCRSITGGPSGRNLERELLPPSWLPIEDLVYLLHHNVRHRALHGGCSEFLAEPVGKSNKGAARQFARCSNLWSSDC